MPLDIVTVPCLADNYAFLLHDAKTGRTALIDAPETAPIRAALSERGWTLTDILITHHHWDHVEGVAELVAETGAETWGNAADADRLPPLTHALSPGDEIAIGGELGTMIDVSGHTIGDAAFHFPESQAVFTADSLMALGCGRLFEGSPAQMYESLSKLAILPPETMVYSGHEYTASNGKFALTIEPGNAALISRVREVNASAAANRPTVPSSLQEELQTNPFLRAHLRSVKTAIGMENAPDVDVFAEIRARKDRF